MNRKVYGLEKITDKFLKIKVLKATQEVSKIHRVSELAVVKNPSYIYPPYEIYPLANKVNQPLRAVKGIVSDMDGTTTTTEELCLHSLEYMIRLITNRRTIKQWSGLDQIKDYPHVIGNSTTKHVEFLIKKYKKFIRLPYLRQTYFSAVAWTLARGQDENRKSEVKNNLANLSGSAMTLQKSLTPLEINKGVNDNQLRRAGSTLLKQFGRKINPQSLNDLVRLGIDVYYHRYHYILGKIASGQGKSLQKELKLDKRLIEPMPAIGVYLSLIKGWLGRDLNNFYEYLSNFMLCNPRLSYSKEALERNKGRLKKLGVYYQKNPAKIAVVTSSIEYEAVIVLNEVFKVIREQISDWPVSTAKKTELKKKFSSFDNVYDGFISASDSSEMRLKPHRDLFSLALHRLGLEPKDFNKVIGYEDSESGLLAIRAAGISKSVAVPFTATEGHDLSSASECLYGGLPEAILIHNSFLSVI